MRIRKRTLLIGGTVLVGAVTLIYENLGPPPRDHLFALRDSIRVLRVAADSCQARLDVQSASFQEFDARLDSLRHRVREFEGRNPAGIAADSYAVYLEAFDSYNDSVAGWRQRADTVRARWAVCRDIAEQHNQFADSLRRLLEQRMSGDDPRD